MEELKQAKKKEASKDQKTIKEKPGKNYVPVKYKNKSKIN